MGLSISLSQLRRGNLITLYSPTTHIGTHGGDGRYMNTQQSGNVVKVGTVPWKLATRDEPVS